MILARVVIRQLSSCLRIDPCIRLEPGAAPAVDYLFAQILPSHLHGPVWEDFKDDGEVDFGERAITNVLVKVSGLDDRGNMVQRIAQTDSSGTYSFADLRPCGPQGYTLREHQPVAYPDGQEIVGEVNETAVGVLAHSTATPPSRMGQLRRGGTGSNLQNSFVLQQRRHRGLGLSNPCAGIDPPSPRKR